MPQSKSIILGLIAVIVLGGGYMALNSQKTAEVAPQEQTETNVRATEGEPVVNETGTTETTPAPNGKKMAFSEFLKQGGSYKCTVNQYVQNVDTVGTVYTSGDMVRGEFAVQTQGMNIDSNMIVRDGYTYIWSSMMQGMGFKSKAVASDSATNPETGTSGSYAWNAEQIGDYNCEAWNPDVTIFTLPEGVTFSEAY